MNSKMMTRLSVIAVAGALVAGCATQQGNNAAVGTGIGAAAGAGLGAIFGGGKGAAIGALAGGGAGTAGTAFTGNKQIVLPAESLLTFKLDQPVRIVERGRGEPESDSGGDPALKPR